VADDPATAGYGTRCLIARRLIERGVRVVQVFTSNQFWDHHGSIRTSLPAACRKTDQPAAALVTDLERLGLLDETVVMWGAEMGRLPVIQNDAGADKNGRNHNITASVCGLPAVVSVAATFTAPPMNSATMPSKTPYRTTICTRHCSTCSGSTQRP